MRIVAILLSGFIGGLLGGAGQTPSRVKRRTVCRLAKQNCVA
jgi:hypothetical protein